MITCSPGQEAVILSALAGRTDMPDENLKVLAEEISKPVYAGMSVTDTISFLHGEGNAMRLIRHDADWSTTASWLRGIQRRLLTERTDLAAQIKGKWLSKIPILLAAYEDGYRYNPRTAATFAAIAIDAVGDKIITAEEVEEFRFRWEAVVPTTPVSMIFGEGVVITDDDIKRAREI